MESTHDKVAQLNDLMQTFDRSALNRILKAMQEKDKPKSPSVQKKPTGGPVKTYTSVTKKYTCLMCGSKFSKTYNLSRGEQTTCFTPDGEVHIITLTGKEGELEIPCALSKCSHCSDEITKWSRDRLEHMFCMLIDSITMKEAAVFSAIKKEREVIL
jgi:hypothetical protein